MSAPNERSRQAIEADPDGVAGSELSNDCFGRTNWIVLLCGIAALLAGFAALALNSTVFAPLCIVAAYVAIGASLVI